MKHIVEIKTTTNSSVFNKLYVLESVKTVRHYCHICGRNKGCNARKRRDTATWKAYRDVQYR